MPKKQYKCEICGKRNYIGNVVCCSCVERDLLALNNKIKFLEKRFDKFALYKGDKLI